MLSTKGAYRGGRSVEMAHLERSEIYSRQQGIQTLGAKAWVRLFWHGEQMELQLEGTIDMNQWMAWASVATGDSDYIILSRRGGEAD